MKLQDKFTFGKYRGKTLEHVIHTDISYLIWLEKQKQKEKQPSVIDDGEAREEYEMYVSLMDPEMQGYFTVRQDPGHSITGRSNRLPGRKSARRLYNDE